MTGTGQGDHVDVSLYEPLMFIVGDMIMNYTGTGFVHGRVGNGTGSASPRGVYQAADGKWLAIAGVLVSLGVLPKTWQKAIGTAAALYWLFKEWR